MSIWTEMFDVATVNRLDKTERTIRLAQGPTIPTQEAAEVKIATDPTSYGGDHPGFEIKPKDQGKFDKAFGEWVKANPQKAQAMHDRLEKFAENPDKLQQLQAEIDKATEEVVEKERKRQASALGV